MNLFDYTAPNRGESFTTLLEHEKVKVVRIVSSDRFESIEYVQEEEEWVVLLEGSATLLLDKEEKYLKKGDILLIPARTPHKILEMQQGTLWLALHIF